MDESASASGTAAIGKATIGKSVLLVEDDSWLRYIMAELFADDGYEVREAATGAQALALLHDEPPDVVVLDLNLPDTSGIEILYELRRCEQTVKLPVIVMSGELDWDTRLHISRVAERSDDLIEKPVDVGRLFECVEHAVVD